MRHLRLHASVQACALHTPHTWSVSLLLNLKPHDDENKDSSDDSEYDAFAEELDSNWYNLITCE